MFGMIRIPHRGRIAVSPSLAGDLLWEVVFKAAAVCIGIGVSASNAD